MLKQVLDSLSLGIALLDSEYRVCLWNRWLEIHSDIPGDEITGRSIFEFYPDLNRESFLRKLRSIFRTGTFLFFSQKLHGNLFPLRNLNANCPEYEEMIQSCVLGPVRNEDNSISRIFIVITDITEIVANERKLTDLSKRDSLTGIFNRRHLEVSLRNEFQRHLRYSSKLSIIILDIDNFKKVNDEYGHQCGDHIIKALVADLADNIRGADVIARYGGEEFCCILPETGIDAAYQVAEKIRNLIGQKVYSFEEHEIRVTVSLGVAEASAEVDSVDTLFRIADNALYKAKEEGRNRTVRAADLP